MRKEEIEAYLTHLLEDDPPHLRPQKYIEALQGIGIEGIRKFLASLLEEGIPREVVCNSYFHPNKFFKLGICRLPNQVKLRLHFWSKEHLEVQTPIHFHAWEFASLLIHGSYTHDLFKVIDLGQKSLSDIEAYQQGLGPLPKDCFGMYKIPKRDNTTGKFRPELVKYVGVEKISSKVEQEGSSYFLDREYPHQITINLQEVGSMITLVLTSETDPSRVFTFQPLTQTKQFDNPSPNVDESTVRAQLESILKEMEQSLVT